MKALWRGSKEITESPDSPEWDFQTGKTICTRTFYGPYLACLDKKPLNGQKMAGFDDALLVSNVKIGKQKGGKGKMVVALEASVEVTISDTSASLPKYEIEWTQVDRKLESHDRYSELTEAEFFMVQQAIDAKTSAERTAIVDDASFTDLMLELYSKKIKGQDSYMQWVPVLRRNTTWPSAHKATKCGIRLTFSQLPTALQAIGPDGYVWMKTADRGNQSGRFGKHERQEEWSGFKTIDAEIYSDE